MQFYRPEFLYGLIALAIPIIVHLFQLRKFKTEMFTNVVLLRQLSISSRKSSILKKWLSLLARLLILSCLVLAFAQPYFSNENVNSEQKEIAVFLDNSYSMSLNGENIKLFKKAKEELLEGLPENETFHLATQDERYKNLNANEFKSWLYDIDYTSKALDVNTILSKTQSLFSNNKTSVKEVVVLSDFQSFDRDKTIKLDPDFEYRFIKYTNRNPINFSIDTIYTSNTAENKALTFTISASEPSTQNIPVSIYNGQDLLAKFTMPFEEEVQKKYTFNFENDEVINGRIQIEDSGLAYDNMLFFSLVKPEPISVLVVSKKQTSYLDKIFDNPAFNYNQTLIQNLEYADLSQSDVVILNELQQIPSALRISVKNRIDSNAILAIIPSNNLDFSSYNNLFTTIGLSPYTYHIKSNIKLTKINFGHPMFENVFLENIQNFNYPSFESYYKSPNPQNALSFSDENAFLESKNQVFRFNAKITENSNFTQSPLVVLSFYNLAMQAQSKPVLYTEIGNDYNLKLKTKTNQDEVLYLSKDEEKIIPRQEVKGQNINLQFIEYPQNAGHYVVSNSQNDTLRHLAFNHNRKESLLSFLDLSKFEGITSYERFSDFTDEYAKRHQSQSLWQWFIVFALIFMIIELLLLRFLK